MINPNSFVPLATAAAQAYVALGDAERTPLADGVLDVVAIALAACMPIYGARTEEEPLAPLADADLARGKFIQGAATLHFPTGPGPFTRLAVALDDLGPAIERLKRAGVNFSQARYAHAPRRIPRVAPA